MRIVTFTTLYPNEVAPHHGIFIKNRMDYFDRIADTTRMVIAPVPYFPLLGLNPGSKFHRYNQVAKQESHGNIPVYHPRYMTIPGTNLINVADAIFAAADKTLRKMSPAERAFDLADGHYLYPDGVAAWRLARKYRRPLILTARGSDVNFWMEKPACKKVILSALDYAAKVICVSHALKDRLIRHGVSENKITVIMNGVDRSIFNRDHKSENRGEYLLSVGNLVTLKGHEFILHALTELPDEKLVIIGSGALEDHLKNVAGNVNVADRVTFLAPMSQSRLATYYREAKGTILMSSMEGMPNVILESLACGTPVIATNVGGIPEVVTEDNGVLLSARTVEALTAAVKLFLSRDWNPVQISQDMTYLDWPQTARELHHIFSQSLALDERA